jgi:predicted nuclease with TOPRIM domain
MTPTNDLPTQLREYNRWRRGGEGWHPNPSKIGAMIDEAADRLEQLERELAVWHHEAKRLEAELAKFDETAIEWWCEYQDLKAKAREP